jgi:hypothetical protein
MSALFNNGLIYGNEAAVYGGGILNSYVTRLRIINAIIWGNRAGKSDFDSLKGGDITYPDLFNAGSGSVEIRHSIMQTLDWGHGSVSEIKIGSISTNPQFLNSLGDDGLPGTEDDNFQLWSNSPAIDRADGNFATARDILGRARIDFPGVSNTGIGTPNFADIGAYERYPAAETPVAEPPPGRYSGQVFVRLVSSTPGAVIRYTLDNTTPTSNSPSSASVITITTNTKLRARAFAFDYQASPEFIGDYTVSGSGKSVRADFDGDGRSDYGFYNPATGAWSLMQSRDGARTASFGYQGTISFVGDFDGDGRADFGCYDPVGIPGLASPGSWYIMQSRAGFRTETFGYPGTIPIVGDFDGDGITDFGCYDPVGIPGLALPGSWYIMQSRDGFRTETFGYAGTIPFVGDFDGDGRADFGCYDPVGIPGLASPGSWYIMQSRAGFRTETFGYAGTIPIVGDFDGDGITDFGCYDPVGIPGLASPGSWYIMQSRNGFRTETFGYKGTIPVVGDYDGDGIDDFGCYDPSGIPGAASPGSWYIMQSRNGFRTETLGFAGTEPVGK